MWEVTINDDGLESETLDMSVAPKVGDILEGCMKVIQITSFNTESRMAIVEIEYL